MVPINYVAVLVAAIVSMVVGYVWYGPLFGAQWMKLMGWGKEMPKSAEKNMGMSYGLMFVGSLVMAYVLAHLYEFAGTYMGVSGAPAGLSTGFWNWLGFVVPVTLTPVLWEGKSWKLWALNASYYLVSLLLMGVVIAMWR